MNSNSAITSEKKASIYGDLSGGAIDTLHCLFIHGPTFDGDVPSKCGRDELVERKLAMRHDGYQTLTISGLRFCLKIGMDRLKEQRQREQRERSSLFVTTNRERNDARDALARQNDVAKAVRAVRNELRPFDFIEPGPWMPSPPRESRWFRRDRDMAVTDSMLEWAGQIALDKTLHYLNEALRLAGADLGCSNCGEVSRAYGNGLCFKCAPKGQWPSFTVQPKGSPDEGWAAAAHLTRLSAENEALKAKLRMIVSHATGGALHEPEDIDRHTNEIAGCPGEQDRPHGLGADDERRYTTGRDAKSGQFIVDGKYLRKQAGEAVETFFAPLSGTFRAPRSAT